MLEKTKKIGLLFDYYGRLLTERQQNIIRLYYYHDLSLGEIADKEDISRQAVYDHLQRGEKLLVDYEEKLNFIKTFRRLKNDFENIVTYIKEDSLIESKEKKCLLNMLNDMQEYL